MISKDKRIAATKLLHSTVVLAKNGKLTARRLAKACGTVMSLSKAFGFTKIMLKNAYVDLLPAI
jgi:hypothetical protein